MVSARQISTNTRALSRLPLRKDLIVFVGHEFYDLSSFFYAYLLWFFRLSSSLPPVGVGGGNPLHGLYGEVPLGKVWLFASALKGVYNF